MILFKDKKYVDTLITIINKWNNANFKMNANNPYREVDCGRLIGNIYKELNIFTTLKFPEYTPKCWYIHNDIEQLKIPLEYHLNNFLNIGLSYKKYHNIALCIGDIILIKNNRCKAYNHIGIFYNDLIFSADVGGVKFRQFNNSLKTITYRIYKCQPL